MFDVAGEQAGQGRLGPGAQLLVELQHAGAGAALAIRNDLLQPVQVGGEEAVEVRRRRFDAFEGEKLAHQRDVGSPGEFEPLGAVRDAELGGKSAGKSLHTRAARVNKRPINVKQNQMDHVPKITGGTREMQPSLVSFHNLNLNLLSVG